MDNLNLKYIEQYGVNITNIGRKGLAKVIITKDTDVESLAQHIERS